MRRATCSRWDTTFKKLASHCGQRLNHPLLIGRYGIKQLLLKRGNKSRRFRVSSFRSSSGLKANRMRKLLPLLIAIFVIFNHLNGEPVAINPESVSSVHPTAPGYPVGTMIDCERALCGGG
jgi:hypothetical protein